METIYITEKDDNKRLDVFLLKKLNNLSRSLIYKYLNQNKIKVNNKPVEYNYLLKSGDEVKLFFDYKNKEIEIIYQDENILVVNKPCGIECINNQNNKDLISQLKQQIKDENLKLVHRIDTNTNGLVIATKNINAYDAMNELIKNNEISKYYQTLVYGHLTKKEETLKDYLIKDSKKGIVRISKYNEPNSKQIITKYRVIKEYKKYSLIEVQLVTGRTHQIRAHMNYISHPIVGEKKYIKKEFDKDTRFKYQALTAYKIIFNIKDKNNFLYYLNNKTFKLKEIEFLKKLDF